MTNQKKYTKKDLPIKNIEISERLLISNVTIRDSISLTDTINVKPLKMVLDQPFGSHGITIRTLLKKEQINPDWLVVSLDYPDRVLNSLDPNDWLETQTDTASNRARNLILSAISLSFPKPINPVLNWQGYELPEIHGTAIGDELLLNERMAYSIPSQYLFFGSIVPSHHGSSIKEVNKSILSDNFKKLNNLKGKHLEAFVRSLSRAVRANHRTDISDRAIDVGMAVEIIFLHGESGVGAKGELRYKISNRGAWLLGKDKNHRKEIVKAIKKGYDVRSAAAHTGQIDKKEISHVNSMYSICITSLRKILDMGEFPTDWNEIVL